jgi:hypothetical protein
MKNITRTAIAVFGATLLLASCTTPKPLATILIIDTSASALNDQQFAEISKTSCHSFAKGLHPTDLAKRIPVNGNIPRASDLAQVVNPRSYHHSCQEQSPNAALVSTTTRSGTFVCPALELAYDLSHRKSADSLPVLYVSVVQTNELDSACPDSWRKLAADAQHRQGKLLIVGSSVGEERDNPALDNRFNTLLWQSLKDSPSTVFCNESSVKNCIDRAFLDVRTPPKGKSE